MEQVTKRIKNTHISNNKRKRVINKPYHIKKKFAPNIKLTKRKTPQIIHACATGKLKIVDELIKQSSDNVNVTENTGRTPLMFAVIVGKHFVVQRLLEEQKIDVDKVDNSGNTALKYAHNYATKCPNATRYAILAHLYDYIENGKISFNKRFISLYLCYICLAILMLRILRGLPILRVKPTSHLFSSLLTLMFFFCCIL